MSNNELYLLISIITGISSVLLVGLYAFKQTKKDKKIAVSKYFFMLYPCLNLQKLLHPDPCNPAFKTGKDSSSKLLLPGPDSDIPEGNIIAMSLKEDITFFQFSEVFQITVFAQTNKLPESQAFPVKIKNFIFI